VDLHGTLFWPDDVIGIAGSPLMPAAYGTEMLVDPGTRLARLLHAGRNETSAQNINIIFHFLSAIFTKHLVSQYLVNKSPTKQLFLKTNFCN